MLKSLIFTVFILVDCNGDHPTPILDAIIGGASRIRQRIQNAGSFLDNLTHGNRGALNIGGSFGVNKEPDRPGTTGYGPGPNGYGPGPNGYGSGTNGYGTGPNGYGPGPNGYGPGPNGYGPGPNGQGPRPNGYEPEPNGNGPEYPGRPEYNQGPNNNNQNNRPNYGQNNQNYDFDNTKQENMPNYYNANDDKKSSVDGKTTHGGSKYDDGPIRVPLNPNEVIYEGDKVEYNAPKREASKNDEAADDDQEYNIDIRFNKDE